MGWDPPKSHSLAQVPNRQNPRWPARVGKPTPYKWPKTRDLKAQPIDEGSDGGVSFKSNSNGDPDYDVKKLMDWNGDWLPPPETWSARKGFTDRHFGAGIETWMNRQDKSCTVDLTNELASSDYLGYKVEGEFVLKDGEVVADRYITKELAPRSWVPVQIEGDAPQQFWRALPSRAPPPLSDIDLTESRPFWEAYPGEGNSCFLQPHQVPEAKIDEADEENQMAGVKLNATQMLYRIEREKQNKQRKAHLRQNRPIPPSPLPVVQMPDRRIQTDVNVYLRPVVAADTKGIRVCTWQEWENVFLG